MQLVPSNKMICFIINLYVIGIIMLFMLGCLSFFRIGMGIGHFGEFLVMLSLISSNLVGLILKPILQFL